MTDEWECWKAHERWLAAGSPEIYTLEVPRLSPVRAWELVADRGDFRKALRKQRR